MNGKKEYKSKFISNDECLIYVKKYQEARQNNDLKTAKYYQDKIILGNMPLIYKLAGMYKQIGADFEDLVNEGVIGMYQASQNFDLSRDNKFSTYAFYLIREKIFCFIINNSKTIRIPKTRYELFIQYLKIQNKHLNEQSKPLSIEQSAHVLNVKLKYLQETLNMFDPRTSLDQEQPDSEINYYNLCASNDFEDKVINKLTVDAYLNLLTPKERDIITKFYGLVPDGISSNSREIAKEYNCSFQRILKIKDSAIKRLQLKYQNSQGRW